ncbi:hypothetical protein MKX03_025642, partial [Papaver bracteatum]
MDRPTPSSSVCNFKTWERLAPMVSARGSFACIGNSKCGEILVAGGGVHRDGVILELKNGGKCREIGVRRKLGNVVVVDGGENRNMPILFMLDENDIFRYDNSSNRWVKESSIARKSPIDSSFGFAALNGEVHWSPQKTEGNVTTRNVLRFSFKLTAPRGEHGDLWQQRHLLNPPWTLKL